MLTKITLETICLENYCERVVAHVAVRHDVALMYTITTNTFSIHQASSPVCAQQLTIIRPVYNYVVGWQLMWTLFVPTDSSNSSLFCILISIQSRASLISFSPVCLHRSRGHIGIGGGDGRGSGWRQRRTGVGLAVTAGRSPSRHRHLVAGIVLGGGKNLRGEWRRLDPPI